ncbi:hypothetical protein BD310DRAFT_931963 [Dichomitus squalens]|uniref:Uncharacterized protein n=1 Tax=Dichomitus squalens TaxID=114155 RepID=A0A4Q9PPH0_9APHY|nr:hypothetical protein BD310DRAFT_931963 [Dichomitus squalens]
MLLAAPLTAMSSLWRRKANDAANSALLQDPANVPLPSFHARAARQPSEKKTAPIIGPQPCTSLEIRR